MPEPQGSKPKPGDPVESKIEYNASGGIEIKCADPKVKVQKR